MSCEITGGRSQTNCKDATPGIQYVYLTNFENIASTTVTANKITAITMVSASPVHKFYKFMVNRQSSDIKTDVKSSIPNSSINFEQKVNLVFGTISNETNVLMNNIARGLVVAIAVDKNGKAWMCGRANGLDLSAGTMETGKAGTDLNGYTLTLTGEEPAYPIEVDTTVLVTPLVDVAY